MAKVDVNSQSWKAVLLFIEQQKDEAVRNLINDAHSEQQRGAIRCLEKLEELADKEDVIPVTEVNYN